MSEEHEEGYEAEEVPPEEESEGEPVEEDGKIIGIVSYYRLVLYGLKDLIDD